MRTFFSVMAILVLLSGTPAFAHGSHTNVVDGHYHSNEVDVEWGLLIGVTLAVAGVIAFLILIEDSGSTSPFLEKETDPTWVTFEPYGIIGTDSSEAGVRIGIDF